MSDHIPVAAALKGDRAAHRVLHVDLTGNEVGPSRRSRVLEIRHENLGAGIERVDHHLAVDRTGDFRPPVLQVLRHGRHLPRMIRPDVRRLAQKVRHLTGVDPLLPLDPRGEQTFALAIEFTVQSREEFDRFRREHTLLAGLRLTFDFDAFAHDELFNR
jgi:hypothetical protein